MRLTPDATVDGLNGGDAQGRTWYRGYSLPAAENPAAGNSEPCVRLGRTGSILLGIGYQPVTCPLEQGDTVLVWGISWVCDNASRVVDPSSYGTDEAAQIRCALKGLRENVESVSLIVDGSTRVVDLHARRYLICSPQQRVRLRADNPFGYSPGPATFTACGYVAWLQGLPLGLHNIYTVTTFFGTSETHEVSIDINVTPRHRSGGDD